MILITFANFLYEFSSIHDYLTLIQFSPVDTPAVVNAFLEYWKPYALVLVESELWSNLVLIALANGVSINIFYLYLFIHFCFSNL